MKTSRLIVLVAFFLLLGNLIDGFDRRGVPIPAKMDYYDGYSFLDDTDMAVLEHHYSYDRASRLVKDSVSLDGRTTAVRELTYGRTGKLRTDSWKDASGGLSMGYWYNIRDWQTSQESPVFTEETGYTETFGAASGRAYFSGNAASVFWKHKGTAYTTGYVFDYDSLSRYVSSERSVKDGEIRSSSLSERGISYDLNGNIISLTRTDSTGAEDVMTFAHWGDRLSSVTSSLFGNAYFVHDNAGNMTSDPLDSLTITYNTLGLPASLTRTSNGQEGTLSYTYSPGGTRLASTLADGTGLAYIGSMTYRTSSGGTVLESVDFGGGKLIADSSGTDTGSRDILPSPCGSSCNLTIKF